MSRDLSYNETLRKKILAGVDKLADTIKLTLGPKGRNVILYRKPDLQGAKWSDAPQPGAPAFVTNDGVTIAQSIILDDPLENMGAQLIVEAAEKTNELAGDGTTTASLLTQSIIREGYHMMAAGVNPIALRRGIEKAESVVLNELKSMAVPVNTEAELAQVATLSCQDQEIGKLIGEAFYKVGPEGVVNINDTFAKTETHVTYEDGITFDRGYLSPHMITDQETLVAELHSCYVLMTDLTINSSRQILDLLIEVAETNKPLLIIAEKIEEEPLGMLIKNKVEGDLEFIAIEPPMYGEGRVWRLQDLAVQTGGNFISKELGMRLEDAHIADLGTAEYVKVAKKETIILGAGGDPKKVKEHENMLRKLVDSTDYEFNKKRHQERLAKFVSGVATIAPGGRTELEIKEKKLRIEDAVNAVRAAAKEGILPGGGTAFINCIPVLSALVLTLEGEEKIGAQIVLNCLSKPLWQIAENAGENGSTIVDKVQTLERGHGFNAASMEYVNMAEAGIIDPLMVTRLAFESACSVAKTLLTTGAAVV